MNPARSTRALGPPWPFLAVAAMSLALIGPSVAIQPAATSTAPRLEPAAPAAPANPLPAQLSLELIMSDPDWVARSPERPYWSDDSKYVYYLRKRPGDERRDTVRVDAATGESLVLSPAELPAADVRFGAYSAGRLLKAYARGGDLYLKDLASGRVQQLTRTSDLEFAPRFLVGDYRLAFQRGPQTYVRDLSSGLEYQVADVRAENRPDDKDTSDKPDYLRSQQERLFDIVRKNKAQRDAAKQLDQDERDADLTRTPRPWYLGEDTEIREQSLSPAGDFMIVRLARKGAKPGKPDTMPAYVSDDGYVSTRNVRSKVGTGTPATEWLVLLDLGGRPWKEPTPPTPPALPGNQRAPGSPDDSATTAPDAAPPASGNDGVFKLDLSVLPGITDNPLKDLQDAGQPAPSATPPQPAPADAPPTTSPAKQPETPRPRPLRVRSIEWNEDGSLALVHVFSLDNKDRWIALANPATRSLVPLEHFRDEAWINEAFSRVGWLRDGRTIWFVSEEAGYAQVYFRDVLDQSRWPLRPAAPNDQPCEVVDVDINLAGDAMYLVASLPGRPGVREAYRALIGTAQFDERRRFAEQGSEVGFPVQQLTDFGGQNQFWASPDGRLGLVLHSTTTRPPELFVVPILAALSLAPWQARPITTTVTPEFAAIPWIKPQIVPIPARDEGRVIWSRVYDAQDASRGAPGQRDQDRAAPLRPAVIFIHGAGYLQNAHEGWSSYFREFMFHSLLARRGYVVLDMDYRASAGYGRDWRTAIYRRMGHPELDDLQDGVAWLVSQRGVDPDRIGCYGGSYGGFLTLMAMFTRPGLFVCGAALRPVTDWAHYTEGYTSNILNLPSLDPESYARSSPIEHAAGLRGHLLICHGMLDDNVLFQDTVRLTQRLIELKKEHWEVAMYPVEPHGFKEPTSWLDEYRRIDRLFRTHLEPRSAEHR